ncbi:MAG: acetate--CoA ligase family protein [Candidatus Micrarchaeota archaeon]|nr:acetate--CoA ligase family protein [Candidatus Micrarchaeota archaeon]
MADFNLLSKYGIAVAPYKVAKSPQEAASAARELGFPVALKVVSLTGAHKTEKGGVLLGIKSPQEAEKAYQQIASRFAPEEMGGVLVQKMVGQGAVELIVGGKKDEQFGHLIMLGMGGIFVEIYKDITFRICPISSEDAYEMIGELRSKAILEGARGRKPVNKRALVSTMLAVSSLLEKESPKEFDINPLMADEKGCVAVDMRIIY